MEHPGVPTLTPPQSEVLSCGLLDSGLSCILQMPTGSGKTWLALRAMQSALLQGHRAVYLTPLRALASELTARWRTQLGPSVVGVFTGDYGAKANPYPVPFERARLLVMTPERLDACTRTWRLHWSWIAEVDLLVVDEIHLLGDPSRGARLEGALSRFRRLNPFARVLGLSATLGNRQELASWLDGVEYASTWRPVPLRWRIVRYGSAGEKPGLLSRELERVRESGGRSLVFVQSRRRAEQLSGLLRDQGLRAAHHHAGLAHRERAAVQEGFGSGRLEAVVATATLEMGLNLPVRQVVLYDLQEFDGTGFRPLTTNCVWQRAGRAGRPGLDPEGEVLLLAPRWEHEVEQYPQGRFESIRSGLANPGALAEQVVAEVASGLSRTPTQVARALEQSLAAQQGVLPDVGTSLARMLEAGMLREEAGGDEGQARCRLTATRLGRITARHMLAPETVLRFGRVLSTQPVLTFLDLLMTLASSPDCEPVLPVDFEELGDLGLRLGAERSVLLSRSWRDPSELLGVEGRRFLSALKMALVVRTWTRLGNAPQVAETHGCYPFEVERLCESVSRLLLGLGAVATTMAQREEGTPIVSDVTSATCRIHALQAMVAAGLDEEAATLTLVGGIGPRRARQLWEAGVTDLEALSLSEPQDLVCLPGISLSRSQCWIQRATEALDRYSAFSFREEGQRVSLAGPSWPRGLDPYRLRRALDLTVGSLEDPWFQVSGGLEPHRVRLRPEPPSCDCLDFAQGHLCKHLLAVRLRLGDPDVSRLAQSLSGPPNAALSLLDLWYGGGTQRGGSRQ